MTILKVIMAIGVIFFIILIIKELNDLAQKNLMKSKNSTGEIIRTFVSKTGKSFFNNQHRYTRMRDTRLTDRGSS